jgi:phenylacetic acid degradation operon negative regulatory protein
VPPGKFSIETLVLRRAEEGSLLPRHQAGASPQRLLTDLLSEHWLESPSALPMSALIALLAEFGITESSARATVNRLVKRGVLESERAGRQAYLRLSDIGREDSRQKTAAIVQFGAEQQDWDGLWTVAAFSIPEEQRHVRHRVRSYLRWLGFAPLFDGLWVSPHPAPESLEQIFRAAGVENLTVLRSTEAGGSSPLSAWDLAGVGEAYRAFIDEHRQLAGQARAGDVTPSAALAARVTVFEAWRQFPGLDPDLPHKLLPDDWPRAEARATFVALYDGLGPLAALRFRQIVGAHDPELAELVGHRTAADWTAAPDRA